MNNKKSKQGNKRANNKFEPLYNSIKLLQYITNEKIKLIYKVFEYHFNDVKREDIINNKEILLGLWKYWLMNNFRDLNYKVKVSKVKVRNDKGKVEIWEKWKEHKYKDYEYILSILEIDNYFYNPKVWEQFIKDYDDMININKVREDWNDKKIPIAKYSKKGNKIISFFENLDLHEFINITQKTYEELIKQRDENISLNEQNENIKKQRGTINQYFPEWESQIVDISRGKRKDFYEKNFIKNKPELKNYPYEKFVNNYKSQICSRKKALHKKALSKG